MKKTFVFPILLCTLFALAPMRAETIRFGQTGRVTITPPKGWQTESRKDAFGPGNHTVTLIADKSRKPGCTITILAGERQPAHTEASFLASVGAMYAESAVQFQFVEKTPSFKKLNIKNGFGYYCIASYAAMVGKPPAKGSAKVCGCVLIYRENNPLVTANLFVDDPKDPALDLMVDAICEMEVALPGPPANRVQFDTDNFIKIDIPPGWGAMRMTETPLPDTEEMHDLKLTPPAGEKASLTIKIGKRKSKQPLTKKQFEALAGALAKPILAETVENEAVFKEMPIHGGHGLYCVFTDASLVNKTAGPHEYKYAGLFLANYNNGHIAYATAVADDPESANFKRMLEIFSSIEPFLDMSVKTPPVQTRTNARGTLIGNAAGSVKLLIPSKKLKNMDGPRSGNQKNPGYFYLEDINSEILMSGWIEPAEKFEYASARELWDTDFARQRKVGQPEPVNVEYRKIGDWDVLLYDVPVPEPFRGRGVCNAHLRANLVQAGTWIDLHLSKTDDKESASLHDTLVAYLKTLQIEKPTTTGGKQTP